MHKDVHTLHNYTYDCNYAMSTDRPCLNANLKLDIVSRLNVYICSHIESETHPL